MDVVVERPAPGVPPAGVGVGVSRRLRGVDVARALAIVGMVMVHVGPYPGTVQGVDGTLYGLTYGRASVLFVVLAGVGVTLLTGDRSRHRIRDARLRLVVRALLLFPLGLALEALDTNVAVILQYYAVYFLVAALALRLPDRWLAGLAVTLFVVGPLAVSAGWQVAPEVFEGGGKAGIGEPFALARDLVLSGYYPVVTWAPPLLLGMWVGRRDLRSPRVRWALLTGGVVVAALAYGGAWLFGEAYGVPTDPADPSFLASARGHTEMPPSVIGATAVAVAVLGAALLVAGRLPRLVWPLAAMGQLALSVYVGHLLVMDLEPDLLVRTDVAGATFTVARFLAVTLVIATLWRAVLPRGPLEAAFHAPWALWQGLRGRGAPPG